MSPVNELLDKYKKAKNLNSDNACAESLGLHRASVSEWRRGKSWPSEAHIVELATAANEDAGLWLVSINAERAPPGAVQREWVRLASRFTQAAAAVAGAFLIVRYGGDGHALAAFFFTPAIHYAKSVRCLDRRLVAASVAGTSPPRVSASYATAAS